MSMGIRFVIMSATFIFEKLSDPIANHFRFGTGTGSLASKWRKRKHPVTQKGWLMSLYFRTRFNAITCCPLM